MISALPSLRPSLPHPHMDAQAKPPLFGLHLHPGVDVVSIQVILLHLATGPHLHAVCEVAAAWGQDEVINEHCQGTSNEWPDPENLGEKCESLEDSWPHYPCPRNLSFPLSSVTSPLLSDPSAPQSGPRPGCVVVAYPGYCIQLRYLCISPFLRMVLLPSPSLGRFPEMG